jgi:hypothetical protein
MLDAILRMHVSLEIFSVSDFILPVKREDLESRSITMSAFDIIGVVATALQFSIYISSKIMILLAPRLWKSGER